MLEICRRIHSEGRKGWIKRTEERPAASNKGKGGERWTTQRQTNEGEERANSNSKTNPARSTVVLAPVQYFSFDVIRHSPLLYCYTRLRSPLGFGPMTVEHGQGTLLIPSRVRSCINRKWNGAVFITSKWYGRCTFGSAFMHRKP